MKIRSGFTLIELIITISIIALLAATVFISIDPVRRLNIARNARRTADTTIILDALKAYQADNDGYLPLDPADPAGPQILSQPLTAQIIGEGLDANCTAMPQCAGITLDSADCMVAFTYQGKTVSTYSAATNNIPPIRRYLPQLPADPSLNKTEAVQSTRYYVNIDDDGIITVGACDSEAEGVRGSGPVAVIEKEL